MNLFWKNGYQGTSTRDLLNETALNPGSLYSTFGNKERLLSESIDHYTTSLQDHFWSCQNRHENPLMGLCDFIIQLLLKDKAPSHLCFLFKMQIELKGTDLEDSIRQSTAIFEHEFLQVFIKAQSLGFLTAQKDSALLVKTFQTRLLGWRAFLTVNPDTLFIQDEIKQYFLELND